MSRPPRRSWRRRPRISRRSRSPRVSSAPSSAPDRYPDSRDEQGRRAVTTGVTVLFVLVVLLAALVAAFVYRLGVLRRGGTAAIVRTTPAGVGQGWRHGVIRYGEEDLV